MKIEPLSKLAIERSGTSLGFEIGCCKVTFGSGLKVEIISPPNTTKSIQISNLPFNCVAEDVTKLVEEICLVDGVKIFRSEAAGASSAILYLSTSLKCQQV